MKTIIKTIFLSCLPFLLFSQTKNFPVTLESPYNTMHVHLDYLQPDMYRPDLAAQTIYGEDSLKAIRLAIQLKQILDGNGLFVPTDDLPTNNNYIDSTINKPYFTLFPQQMPQIYLEKINDKWYFSRETIRLVPKMHKDLFPFGLDALVNLMPHASNRTFLGIAPWQYLGILILLLLTYFIHILLSRILQPLVRRVSQSKLTPELVSEALVWKIARLVSMLILVQLVRLFVPVLQLPIAATKLIITSLQISFIIFLMLLFLRIWDVAILYFHRFTTTTTSKMDEQLVPILRKMVQVVIVIGAIIQCLSLLNVNVTALIAGLSIGGLALALAAQDTVKNLIGSAMIFIDKPFQIGDWIESSGIAGTVLEVGFRTTRLQQMDSSIIAVPNGTIANASITNLGVRKYRFFSTTIGVTYDTPPDLLEKFMEGLKQIILAHPHTRKEGFYVHFTEMAASSLNVLFRMVLEVTDFATEARTKEELLLAVVRLAEVLDIQFAFPSSTVYVEQFPGKEKTTPTLNVKNENIEAKMAAFLTMYRQKWESPRSEQTGS